MIQLIGSLRNGIFVLDRQEIGYCEDWKVYVNGECLGEVETRSEAIRLIQKRIGH